MKAVAWHGKRECACITCAPMPSRVGKSAGSEAYKMFQEKRDGAIKVVLQP